MALKEEIEDAEEQKPMEDGGRCHHGYLASIPGALRILNIVFGATIFGLWIPGYEHDYKKQNQIVSFRDVSKNHGAGYKSETLNQFVLADIIICLVASVVLLIALLAVAHSSVDWNRMNKFVHSGLAMFHGIGAICAAVGAWNFEENCCRVDLEWNGIGFRYTPSIYEFGYPRNNFRCNCWLTKRRSTSETDTTNYPLYSTELWEPEHYPDKYAGEESMFVSFAAHNVQIHAAAVVKTKKNSKRQDKNILMFFNTLLYGLASYFSKPQPAAKMIDTIE